MKRPLALLVIAVIVSGCSRAGSLVPVDPFFGPTTVPPPRTAQRSSPDPSYSNPRRATRPGNVRTATRPSVGNRFRPPSGSFHYQGASTDAAQRSTDAVEPPRQAVAKSKPGDRISIPAAARRDWNWSKGVAASGSDDLPAKLKTAEGSARPANRLPSWSGLSTGLGVGTRRDPSIRQASATAAIDIMDLPPVPSGDDRKSSSGSSSEAPRNVPRARFDFDPEYTWLRGRLDYSEIDRRWKLRYIPIDGSTDEFGGSVVLTETSRLAGCERGDFVEVHGRIVGGAGTNRGYAPDFEVSRIKRLGR